jgi:hypothetical protein
MEARNAVLMEFCPTFLHDLEKSESPSWPLRDISISMAGIVLDKENVRKFSFRKKGKIKNKKKIIEVYKRGI